MTRNDTLRSHAAGERGSLYIVPFVYLLHLFDGRPFIVIIINRVGKPSAMLLWRRMTLHMLRQPLLMSRTKAHGSWWEALGQPAHYYLYMETRDSCVMYVSLFI